MTTSYDPTQYAAWLVSRAAGVTAFLLASVAVVLGLMMAGKLSRRPGAARRMRSLHEHAALGALLAIVVHGVSLLGDRWMHPGLAGITLPFTMGYRPVATGLGIIAGYLAALLGLTFYVRRRIGTRLWRRAHRLTVVVWALSVVHALTAGSDASTPWMRAILVVTAVPILSLFAVRVAGRPRPARPAVAGVAP